MTYVDVDKNYQINAKVPTRFCMTRRSALLSWAYFKLIFDAILLFLTVQSMIDLCDFYDIYQTIGLLIFILLTAVIIADVVFHLKLIYGLSKNILANLIAYCKYTRVLWAVVLVQFAIFVFLLVPDLIQEVLNSQDVINTMLINICSTLATTIIQSLIMLLVIWEIKNQNGETSSELPSPRKRIFSFVISFKIETENEKDGYSNLEGNTTGEKEKLDV